MSNVRFVGLDVHQDTITIAVADGDGSAPAVVGTFSSDIPKLVKQLKRLGPVSNLRCCYEAGAGGFVLERALRRDGIIVAPSLVPTKQSGERVKTDKRDAVRLARFLRSGDLVAIHVPDEETEAMRDLSRARLDAVKAQLRARQQLSRFLVRHGKRYAGKRTSTAAFLQWAKGVEFRFEAQRRVLVDYVRAVEEGVERIENSLALSGRQGRRPPQRHDANSSARAVGRSAKRKSSPADYEHAPKGAHARQIDRGTPRRHQVMR